MKSREECLNPKDLEFEFPVYDLYTGVEKEIRQRLLDIADFLEMPILRGPLFSMTHEITANGLKALYKQIYYRFFLQEVGLEEIPYEDWLKLFKTELEVHQAENFARVCRDKDMFVTVRGRTQGDLFRIEAINDGAPSDVEYRRIKESLCNAREKDVNPYLFLDDDEEGAEEKEGGGIGISMIMMTLKNLGMGKDAFDIIVREGQTFSRLDLPLDILLQKLQPVTA